LLLEGKLPYQHVEAGVDPAEYERWVRERDYALVRSKPNYLSHTVHRIRGPIDGMLGAEWQDIERMEVESLEQHDRDLASPEGVALRAELHGRNARRGAADAIGWRERRPSPGAARVLPATG
jgi:hypothetical protein